MAYTAEQWNNFQATLPVEDRVSYLDYLQEEDPAEYSRVVSSILENLKTAETQSGTTITKIVDESTKIAGAKTDTAAQKTATANAAGTLSRLKTDAQEPRTDSSVSAAESAAAARAKKAAEDERILAEAVRTAELNTRIQAALARFRSGETLSAEDKALLNIDPNYQSPNVVVTTAGPVLTTAGPVLTTAGPVLTTAGPVLTTAGPILTTAGPVLTTAGPALTTKTPGLIKNPGYFTDPTSGLLYKDDVLVEGEYNGYTYKGGFVVGAGGLTTTKAPGGLTYTATDGTIFTDQAAFVEYQKFLTDGKLAKDALSAAGAAERQSAYDLLYAQFSAYGLGSLVEPLRGLIQSGASPAEFTIKLRESEPYKKRFAANAQRISKGLKAIGEAEYLGLEDQYQNILRNAGLPESYWKRGDLGVQEGFTNFIANDVSAVELEDRVSTAQQRLIYANPEVSIALKTFYPDISNGDLLAYALDPTKGLEQIKRRITAAEVGSSAVQLGLTTNVTDAEYLARYGVTKASAQQGYSTIAGGLQRGSQLASIYGEDPYTQTTAEREVFNVPGAQEAKKQRQKITGLEKATFGGQTGLSQGALARDRAGAY